MSILLFANEAQTTLAYPASSTATTIVVAAGTAQYFPSPVAGQSFKLTLISAANGAAKEIVLVTSVNGDVLTVARAQEGTVARAWKAGDYAANLMTAGTGNVFLQLEQLSSGLYPASFTDLHVSGTAIINHLVTNDPIEGTATKVQNIGQVTTDATFFLPFIEGNQTQGYGLNSNSELNFNPNTGKLESPLINAPAGMGGGIF